MGNFVIFSPSFDSPFKELGDAVGQTIRESSSLHLITQHGTDLTVSRRYYDEPYLDFSGVQKAGAGWGGKPLGRDIAPAMPSSAALPSTGSNRPSRWSTWSPATTASSMRNRCRACLGVADIGAS